MTTTPTTVLQAMVQALQKALHFNAGVQVAPACILWPDKDNAWLPALPALRQQLPQLLTLGNYAPALRSGPAIWLKCVMGGHIADFRVDGVPILYLPGVGRSDLRAIESCPRELQPLAELQYRGVFWSPANSRDWTVGAFLSSKNGGLSLDLAQDKATQEALRQAAEADVLLRQPLAQLQGRAINAEWLQGLLAPNPTRDVLAWMNAPEKIQATWGKARWQVFCKRSKKDYGFDPVSDGPLVAAEKLTQRAGKWAAVSELYRDSYTSFPEVLTHLRAVSPPDFGLFPDMEQLSAYPQANAQAEASLRSALESCANLAVGQARERIAKAEAEHGVRRNWLWARMGLAPLAMALRHLARLATGTQLAPVGTTTAELAASYQELGWQVDDAALRALACVGTRADGAVVAAAVRVLYLPWLQEAASRLQGLIVEAGGLPQLSDAPDLTANEVGVCTVFVDGLRYDTAQRLAKRLAHLGDSQITARWTSLPSVTASGKPWCSPVAPWVSGSREDSGFVPRVEADGRPLSGHNFRKLLAEKGVQPLSRNELGQADGRAWTEVGDLDHYGHEHGVRLARDMDGQLAQVVERIEELCTSGWQKIRMVTDHGWLLVPGGLPKTELAKHQAETRWGRCAVLKESAHATPLTFGWSWCKEVAIAYAPGVSSFVAGAEYAHGGLSLQECLVPVLELHATASASTQESARIVSVRWRGLRCVVEVESDAKDLRVDVRSKPALASSSLVASVRALEGGKASVVVEDDDHMGAAAVVVILSSDGQVVQKQATTVAE